MSVCYPYPYLFHSINSPVFHKTAYTKYKPNLAFLSVIIALIKNAVKCFDSQSNLLPQIFRRTKKVPRFRNTDKNKPAPGLSVVFCYEYVLSVLFAVIHARVSNVDYVFGSIVYIFVLLQTDSCSNKDILAEK